MVDSSSSADDNFGGNISANDAISTKACSFECLYVDGKGVVYWRLPSQVVGAECLNSSHGDSGSPVKKVKMVKRLNSNGELFEEPADLYYGRMVKVHASWKENSWDVPSASDAFPPWAPEPEPEFCDVCDQPGHKKEMCPYADLSSLFSDSFECDGLDLFLGEGMQSSEGGKVGDSLTVDIEMDESEGGGSEEEDEDEEDTEEEDEEQEEEVNRPHQLAVGSDDSDPSVVFLGERMQHNGGREESGSLNVSMGTNESEHTWSEEQVEEDGEEEHDEEQVEEFNGSEQLVVGSDISDSSIVFLGERMQDNGEREESDSLHVSKGTDESERTWSVEQEEENADEEDVEEEGEEVNAIEQLIVGSDINDPSVVFLGENLNRPNVVEVIELSDSSTSDSSESSESSFSRALQGWRGRRRSCSCSRRRRVNRRLR